MLSHPGLAAFAVLVLSLAAKLYMSFGINIKQKEGYESLNQDHVTNARKAQLNVAEYEGLFIAIFLFLHLQRSESLLVTIVSVVVPLAQALYFWGRLLSGSAVPWAPLGALPRYASMGIMIYLVGNELYGQNWANMSQGGPGCAALVVLILSLAAKLYMSFGIRIANKEGPAAENASKAQLNVAEYEALFMAVFFFLHVQKAEGILVTVVSYVAPLAQAVYFWGRVITGSAMPCAPIGALTRYACMGIMIYLVGNALYGVNWANISQEQFGPGCAALGVLILSLSAKLYMSFGIRIANKTGPEAENASKAQLNVAEYEGLFMAIFFFLHEIAAGGMLLMVVSIVVVTAQAVYFWGRTLTGQVMPWAPLGALPRYICMGILSYVLYTEM